MQKYGMEIKNRGNALEKVILTAISRIAGYPVDISGRKGYPDIQPDRECDIRSDIRFL